MWAPANTTYYVKLQDAFVSESGTNYGSWKMIGYKMETTNNVFTYTEEKDLSGSKETDALPTEAADVWSATPKAALNDCSTSDSWTLAIRAEKDGNGAAYTAKVSSTECNVLVPGFGKLDKTGSATVGS